MSQSPRRKGLEVRGKKFSREQVEAIADGADEVSAAKRKRRKAPMTEAPRESASASLTSDVQPTRARSVIFRAQIAKALAQGMTQRKAEREFAESFGITQLECKQIISDVLKEFMEQTHEDVDVWRSRQIAMLLETVEEATKAFHGSVKTFDIATMTYFYDSKPDARFLEHISKAVMNLASLTGTRRPFVIAFDEDKAMRDISERTGLPVMEVKAMHEETLAARGLAGKVTTEKEEAN